MISTTELIEGLNQRPETYKTILGENSKHNTKRNILSRKVCKLIKSGEICISELKGKRSLERIFFSPDKQYHILMTYEQREFRCYYFHSYVEEGKYRLRIKKAYLLNCTKWIELDNYLMFRGDILKWI